jgi:hypothetical protein
MRTLKNVAKLYVLLNPVTDSGYLHKDKHSSICKAALW